MDVKLRLWKINKAFTTRHNYRTVTDETSWNAAPWDDGINTKPTWAAIDAEDDTIPNIELPLERSENYTTANMPTPGTENEGRMLYNMTIKKKCYCDGTDWRRMDTDAIIK